MKRILLIDDDAILTMLLSGILKKSGYDVTTAPDGTTGLHYASTKNPELIITDYQMPDFTGMEVLGEIKKRLPDIPVIMLTAHGDVSLTIKAIQNGAFDFIEKPINPKEILEAIANGLKASERSKTLSEAITPGTRKSMEENLLAGKTPVMRDIFKNIGRVSMNKVNVVVMGETGTGKERVARMIHYSGISRDYPFISINCSAVGEEELDKELFGGLDARIKGGIRIGKLSKAGLGTIFLSEFTMLTPRLQARLLDFINNSLRHIETDQPPFSARIIASTSRNIDELVDQGLFMNELYYHLKVFSFQIPSLRHRKEDISELTNHILQQLNRSLNKKIHKIDDGVISQLQTYDWPGNVRELKNILMQAMILSHGDVLEQKHIIIPVKPIRETTPEPVADGISSSAPIQSLADVEKIHIQKIFSYTNRNKQETAKLLGITRPTLNAKLEKYGIV